MSPPTLRSRIALASAALAALALLLHLRRRKASYLITNFARIAAQAGKGAIQNAEYDVIIIGGGTAGCVLASRLSENPDIRVLLLEAGGSGVAQVFSQIPSAYSRLFHTPHVFDLYTVPQPNAGGKPKYWPRGKLLGGCSSVNASMFHYGAPSDYDEWADESQPDSQSWAYNSFSKYFLKFERFTPSPIFPLVDPSLRGSSGPIQVGYFGNFSKIASGFLDACEAIGIPKNPDVNTARGTLGATKIMTYTDSRGRRVSTESAYLTPEVLRRPNLKVAIHAHVTRILFETAANGEVRASGVEFTRDEKGARYRVKATREVILSAGAIHSPQILMLSGVGPASELASHGIPLVKDLPGVGKNLLDHVVVNIRYRAKPGHSLSYLRAPSGPLEIFRTVKALLQFNLWGTGPLTSNIAEGAAFLRSDDPKLFGEDSFTGKIEDTTSGGNAPDLEFIVCPTAWAEHGHGWVPKGDLVGFGVILLRPTSNGTLTLKSASPFDAPVIDPHYLDTAHDVAVLVRGLRALLRATRTPALAGMIDARETDAFLDHKLHERTDAALEDVVRERAETLYHPTSTCRMASLEKGGVVDFKLRVHGVKGLRVADASVFPTIMAGHTAAPSIAVGEKLADELAQEFKTKA